MSAGAGGPGVAGGETPRRLLTPADPEHTLGAVAEAAEDWGGEW